MVKLLGKEEVASSIVEYNTNFSPSKILYTQIQTI